MEEHTDIKFKYAPILLGGIYERTNNVPPSVMVYVIANETVYTEIETNGFLKHFNIEKYFYNPYFSADIFPIFCARNYASDKPYFNKSIENLFAKLHRKAKNLNYPMF